MAKAAEKDAPPEYREGKQRDLAKRFSISDGGEELLLIGDLQAPAPAPA